MAHTGLPPGRRSASTAGPRCSTASSAANSRPKPFFAASGEARFREEEYNALSEIFADNGKDLILALGGGTLTKPECAELVKSKSTVIYLYCNEEALFKRLLKGKAKRPLLADKSDEELKEHIRNLVSKRESAYTSAASFTVDTSVRSCRLAMPL